MPKKKKTPIKIDRMLVFEDLVDARTDDVLRDVGVFLKNKIYKRRPKSCPNCGDPKMECIEVLGTGPDPLFWGCEDCGYLFMRFNKQYTKEMLDLVRDTWTNPNDWGYMPKAEFS